MHLTTHHREIFRQASGLILPAWRNMPDAASLGIQMKQLDRAMKVRPDLIEPFVRVLNDMNLPFDFAQIKMLRQKSPTDFRILRMLVCGAYYMHPTVKTALGYQGQQAVSLPRGGFGGEELVVSMMEQPKRYRDIK